jgi:hypothetical protein
MNPDFRPTSTGDLKLGGLKKLNGNMQEMRITVPIPSDYHSYEELTALKNQGEWKDVVLSSIAIQLDGWDAPKVRTYNFLGRVIGTEKIDGGTAVTFDKFGKIEFKDVTV